MTLTKLYTLRLEVPKVDPKDGDRIKKTERELKRALGGFAVDFRNVAEGCECSVQEWSGGWSEH